MANEESITITETAPDGTETTIEITTTVAEGDLGEDGESLVEEVVEALFDTEISGSDTDFESDSADPSDEGFELGESDSSDAGSSESEDIYVENDDGEILSTADIYNIDGNEETDSAAIDQEFAEYAYEKDLQVEELQDAQDLADEQIAEAEADAFEAEADFDDQMDYEMDMDADYGMDYSE